MECGGGGGGGWDSALGEGRKQEGKAFRVLGFNQNQRAAFVQILMRLLSLHIFFMY